MLQHLNEGRIDALRQLISLPAARKHPRAELVTHLLHPAAQRPCNLPAVMTLREILMHHYLPTPLLPAEVLAAPATNAFISGCKS